MGERYGIAMLESLKKTPLEKLRPRWTLPKILAFVVSASVHLLSLALFFLGLFLIASGYPKVPPVLYGMAACVFAWFMRPKPGKIPSEDVVSQTEFPALYALVNDVARELGGRPIHYIVVNENFNAAYGVLGWRRVPVLWIGLPLWVSLRPQERLALLGHEIAHGINGDGARSFVVSSALAALDQWIVYLRAPLAHAATLQAILAGYLTWILSVPFAVVQRALAQLLWFNKQQAEYFADHLGSMIAGTDATISTLQRLACKEHLDDVLLRNVYSNSQSGAHMLSLFRQRIENLPHREWLRLARATRREKARLDASHPPTAHRIEFLEAKRVAEPRIIAEENQMSAVDRELSSLQERLGGRLIARHARD